MNGNDEINGEIMIVAIVVLSCVVLFTFALHLYAKWFWRRSGTLVGSWSSRPREAEEERERRVEAGAADSGSRSNVGLEKAVVDALPLFVFRSQSSDDVLDCAVCLSGFEENDRGRLLPKCNHAFHVECIETWFYSHSTCPLCRSTVHVHVDPQPHQQQEHSHPQSASSSSSWEMPLADLEAAEGEEGPSSSSGGGGGDSAKSTVTRIRSLRRILGRENIKVFPSNHGGGDVEAGGGQAQAQEQDQS